MPELQSRYLEKHVDQDVLVLTLTTPELCGDDLAEAMRRELLAAVSPSRAQNVALDFRQVDYMASPGIRVLLALRRHFQDAGGKLILCSLNPLLTDILNTTRLINTTGSFPPALFETAADVPAGIARLNAQSREPELAGRRH